MARNNNISVQNVKSRAAMTLFHDHTICSNGDVSRALQQSIKPTQDINVDVDNQKTTTSRRTMSIVQKRKELCPWIDGTRKV
jgi:hypothetical protein